MFSNIRSAAIAAIVLTAVSGVSEARADDYRFWREQVPKPAEEGVSLPVLAGARRPVGEHLVWREQVPAAMHLTYFARVRKRSNDYLPWREQVKDAGAPAQRTQLAHQAVR